MARDPIKDGKEVGRKPAYRGGRFVQIVKSRIVTVRNFLFDAYYWPRSRQEYLDRLSHVSHLAEAIEMIFNYQGLGFYRRLKPNQNRGEILTLVQHVQAMNPKVIVEIGTRAGGTLFLWAQSSPALELLVSIDLPGGIHGGGYPIQRARLYKLFTINRPGCTLELLRTNSQIPSTRATLVELLAGRSIDFLFIDGDHRYNGVKKDYELYVNLVRPGGLIAFHDIRPNSNDASIQVFQLWEEIKAQEGQTEEIIHSPFTGQYGIGLLTKSASQ